MARSVDDPSRIRAEYDAGAKALVALAERVPREAWSAQGLGVWTVRDLVGHASRSLLTVETYLQVEPGPARLATPVDYYLAIREAMTDSAAVAQRGRDAGAALGDDPVETLRNVAQRVLATVAVAADDAPVGTPWGGMRLVDYLPTRTFELAAHGLDLCRALGLTPPAVLDEPVRSACVLAGRLAAESEASAEVLLALTGRTGLPPHLSVV